MAASRSFRNVIAILALIDSLLKLTERECGDESEKELIESCLVRIGWEIEQCYRAWSGEFEERVFRKLDENLREFDERVFTGNIDVIVAISLCLGLLSDTVAQIKDPVRQGAIARLEDVMFGLHKCFDCDLDQFELYVEADLAIKLWYRVFE